MKIALWSGISVVVLLGIYVILQLALANTVPQGVTSGGVAIGGLSRSEAVTKLESEVSAKAEQPLTLVAGNLEAQLRPAQLGLGVNAEATVDQVTGFTLAPDRLWQHLTGGSAVPVVPLDSDVDASALAEAAQKLSKSPVNGAVSFVDGKVYTTDPVAGQAVESTDIAEALQGSWLVQDRIEVPTQVVTADIDQPQLLIAASQADALIAGPVRLTVGDTFIELPARSITSHAKFEANGKSLVLLVDGEELIPEITTRLPVGVLSEPVDATLAIVDGAPKITPGQAGSQIDAAALSAAISKAVQTPDRSSPLPLTTQEPQVTVESLEKLGVVSRVSHFSTVLSGSSSRISNIVLGAKIVNGHLIQPGETFSLDKVLGPSTRERGFKPAGTIINGVLQDSYGGGLSQLTTTIYNASFFAGLDDVEHRPHSMYFARYPEGREATLSRPELDLKFRNDTPYGILLRVYASGGRLHAEMWSTPYYRVETQTSRRSNVVQPKTITKTGSGCISQSQGSPGFSVTVFRQVYLGDEKKKDEQWTWRYNPQNKIVCESDTPPPTTTAPPAEPGD